VSAINNLISIFVDDDVKNINKKRRNTPSRNLRLINTSMRLNLFYSIDFRRWFCLPSETLIPNQVKLIANKKMSFKYVQKFLYFDAN